ncbi:hypothetical protein F4778DRAFT_362801 [Xylariomycetidae sp. FL2044]|nr:hypothetical protein F4778DRAFT_362801 [Xylariomycetidae sp. FL2044]
MSLPRLTLPSRAFFRDKSSSDEGKNEPRKFSTVHIGYPGLRRRGHLSATFTSLFEKPENRQDDMDTEASHLEKKTSQPFGARSENKLPAASPKPSNSDSQEIQETDFLEEGEKQAHAVERSPLIEIGPPLLHKETLASNVVGPAEKRSHDREEVRSDVSITYSSKKGAIVIAGRERQISNEILKSPQALNRVRSISSSYPSEGIRSPEERCKSPEPTAHTQSLISDYTRYGAYPSQSESWFSETSVSKASLRPMSDEVDLNEELADVRRSPATASLLSGGYHTPMQDSGTVATTVQAQQGSAPASQPCLSSIIISKPSQVHQRSSSGREILVPILEAGGASTSTLNVNFMRYKAPINSTASADDTCDQPRNPEARCEVRDSHDSGGTASTTIRNTIQTRDDTDTSDSSTRGLLPPESMSPQDSPGQPRGFWDFNTSSLTLAQRLPKFKFKKWVKKVYRRTGVRFKHVKHGMHPQSLTTTDMPPLTKSKRVSSRKARKLATKPHKKKKSGALNWYIYHGKKRKSKTSGAKKQKKNPYQFLHSLRSKKSINQPVDADEGEKNCPDEGAHRRVKSCPAGTGSPHMGI